MIMSFYYIHHPLYLPQADSLEPQSSRSKFIFPRAGDDTRRKAPRLFEAGQGELLIIGYIPVNT